MAWTYFTEDEVKCKCGKCGGGQMDDDFMVSLDELRTMCGFPFVITSAFRCKAHNTAVGGSDTSRHLDGKAVDVAASGEAAYEILKWAEAFGFTRIGISQSGDGRFIHLGQDEGFALWTY